MSKSRYTILIADDEKLARESIKILLAGRENCEVLAETENGSETSSMINKLRPDIVFLDIQMPEMLGLEVMESITEAHKPVFVLVTAYDQYAVKAFELNAVDYLLKPYSDQRFYTSLDKAILNINNDDSNEQLNVLKSLVANISSMNSNDGRLVIKSAGKIHFVEKEQITHIKASGNYCEIYTAERKHLMYTAISEIEKELNPQYFVRIHRSIIVNKNDIKELESHFNGEYIVHLKTGEQLKLSRSYKEKLETILEG